MFAICFAEAQFSTVLSNRGHLKGCNFLKTFCNVRCYVPWFYFEGSRPEWCISSMIYGRDTPFWLDTLEYFPPNDLYCCFVGFAAIAVHFLLLRCRLENIIFDMMCLWWDSDLFIVPFSVLRLSCIAAMTDVFSGFRGMLLLVGWLLNVPATC